MRELSRLRLPKSKKRPSDHTRTWFGDQYILPRAWPRRLEVSGFIRFLGIGHLQAILASRRYAAACRELPEHFHRWQICPVLRSSITLAKRFYTPYGAALADVRLNVVCRAIVATVTAYRRLLTTFCSVQKRTGVCPSACSTLRNVSRTPSVCSPYAYCESHKLFCPV